MATQEELRKFGIYLANNPHVAELFRKKARFIDSIRSFLNDVGAIELHMPCLQKYREGAPVHQFVTMHPLTNERFYLRHCMEDHLRRVCNAFDRVYELGKAFRVEKEDHSRAIEFLVLEFVGRNITYTDGVDLVCDLIRSSIKEAFGRLDLSSIDFNSLKIQSFNEVMQLCLKFNLKDINCREKSLRALQEKGITTVSETSQDWEIFEELMKHFIEPYIRRPTVLTDFPMCLQHVCDVDETKGHAMRFSVIINGIEICDGGVKFSSSKGYKDVYKENAEYRECNLGITDNEEPQEFYEDIDAAEGPVFTFGFGIDRLFALCAGKCIQEVILFPYR